MMQGGITLFLGWAGSLTSKSVVKLMTVNAEVRANTAYDKNVEEVS